MAFTPQLFLSNIKAHSSLAKPCRYEVVLPIPSYINKNINQSILDKILGLPNTIIADITSFLKGSSDDSQSKSSNASISRYLALQCESAELPGKTLQTADVKIYGPTFKVPYQTTFSDINLTFVCTNEFYERKLFENWMGSIMPLDTNNLRFPKDDETRYMTNITIIQYDDFIKQIFAVELVDAFPIGISPQPLSWSEEGFHRLVIQFAYQKYNVKYEGTYDLFAAALDLFGSRAANWLDQQTGNLSKPFGTLFNNITQRVY